MTLIQETDKAMLWRVDGGPEYEVWIKLLWSTGKMKGQVMVPSDEDFGVRAWCVYSLRRALAIFKEIEEGKRGIRPMVEDDRG